MCEWCDDKNVGDEVILKSAESPFFQNAAAFLDLAICRSDRWRAQLHAWTTVSGRREPLLITEMEINYCPMCGRRLSLADASRKERAQ